MCIDIDRLEKRHGCSFKRTFGFYLVSIVMHFLSLALPPYIMTVRFFLYSLQPKNLSHALSVGDTLLRHFCHPLTKFTTILKNVRLIVRSLVWLYSFFFFFINTNTLLMGHQLIETTRMYCGA